MVISIIPVLVKCAENVHKLLITVLSIKNMQIQTLQACTEFTHTHLTRWKAAGNKTCCEAWPHLHVYRFVFTSRLLWKMSCGWWSRRWLSGCDVLPPSAATFFLLSLQTGYLLSTLIKPKIRPNVWLCPLGWLKNVLSGAVTAVRHVVTVAHNQRRLNNKLTLLLRMRACVRDTAANLSWCWTGMGQLSLLSLITIKSLAVVLFLVNFS